MQVTVYPNTIEVLEADGTFSILFRDKIAKIILHKKNGKHLLSVQQQTNDVAGGAINYDVTQEQFDELKKFFPKHINEDKYLGQYK